MRTEELIRIESLPIDEKIYVVKRFGLTRKNPSPNASVPLVQVGLMCIETGEEIVIETILTHLLVLRLWSVWKNQVKHKEILPSESEKFKLVSQRYYHLSLQACRIAYLIKNKHTGTKKMVEEVDKKNQYILSVFTVFSLSSEYDIYIPSLEILFAAYIPESHYMLRDLISGDLNRFIDQNLNKHEKKTYTDGSCFYIIDPKRQFPPSTQCFLAYLSCNEVSRKNVSKIRASMTKNTVSLNGIKYTAVEVIPYHPEIFNVTVTGLDDPASKRFWVYRIDHVVVPTKCKVRSIKQVNQKSKKDKERDAQKYIANRQSVERDIGLRDNVDAGSNAGMKYIKSNSYIAVPQYHFAILDKNGVGTTQEIEAEKTEAKGASASPPSGQVESANIAMVEYRNESDERDFNQILLAALESIKEEKYFLNNQLDRSKTPSYFKLEKKRTAADTYSNWAMIGKRKRRLIVCEIIINDQYLYLLDIERKNSDTYAGIAFVLSYEMDAMLLNAIGNAVSKNQGRFNKNKNIKRVEFPVPDYKFFYHSVDEEAMGKRIERLISSVLSDI